MKHKGEIVADMPITALSDAAPVYERPYDKRTPRERQSEVRREEADRSNR